MPGTFKTSQRTQTGRARPAGMHGFSLVEVLVAILVLSFGLLGLLGMQTAALQASREARLQSVAAAFATELSEMMRGNPDAAKAAGGNPYFGDFKKPLKPVHASHCLSTSSTTACEDPLDLANSQMSDWLARIDLELPGARVRVCADAQPYDHQGLPQWNCSPSTDALAVVKIGWVQSSALRWKGAAFAFERLERPSLVLPFTAGAGA